jgi:hypothetical protein
MPDKKSPAPKIVQVMTTSEGLISGVLYSNGRVFLWTWTDVMKGQDQWAELLYPDLNAK